ncbi:phage tail tube assembly chaperone [Furfurilactobacillus milii]|uniref:Phage tail protein n=1 Tax=Furfurilactobacillus rossiae TaxID=231049 RepID=A0A7C9MYA2_9LACO|nr:phage tail tube assembly chaperone [Furfurilactobacillus milii]MYV04449.1 phage tail protein [Furfurilactobacillus milii]
MKITVRKIRSKAFDVKTTNRVMDKMYTLQLQMTQADNPLDEDGEDKQVEAYVKEMQDLTHNAIAFLQLTLKLTDDETDKLWDTESAELFEILAYVFQRLMGRSDREIKAEAERQPAKEAEKVDPK